MKILVLALIATLLIAGCIGQAAPTSKSVAPPQVQEIPKNTAEKPPISEGQVSADCKEVYDAQLGQNIIECG